mmetsp:Transcript_81793/g.227753  ORF Transcript_81793/g.227753 Transcript_81793/m.227753 type:complete len:226 (-) Transcript_81793:1630-2307(-)
MPGVCVSLISNRASTGGPPQLRIRKAPEPIARPRLRAWEDVSNQIPIREFSLGLVLIGLVRDRRPRKVGGHLVLNPLGDRGGKFLELDLHVDAHKLSQVNHVLYSRHVLAAERQHDFHKVGERDVLFIREYEVGEVHKTNDVDAHVLQRLRGLLLLEQLRELGLRDHLVVVLVQIVLHHGQDLFLGVGHLQCLLFHRRYNADNVHEDAHEHVEHRDRSNEYEEQN